MIAQRRDKNEQEIVQALRCLGCCVIQMDKSAGFDLLVIRQHVYIIEVKMPDKRDALTDSEMSTKRNVESCGGRYHVATSIEEALAIVFS